jgi:hypothetical protein
MKKNDTDNNDKITDSANKDTEKSKEEKKDSKKGGKKTQAQILQETLGLEPGILENIEQKLFLARFLDYYSEEPIDFIYREKALENYKNQISDIIEKYDTSTEEDKLIKQSFKNKQILETIDKLREQTENIAAEKGFNKSINKKMRNWSILVSIPMFLLIIVFTILPYFDIEINFLYILPVLCVFCMVPTIIRNYLAKKWYNFKEENKMDIYTANREDIMVLKGFVNEVLENVRSRLIELKVPLELIKFVLNSNDYDAVKVINQKVERGTRVYYVRFDYPAGVEPFPIPEELARQYIPPEKTLEEIEEAEKNFVVLENIEAKEGVIKSFVPTLKDSLADSINDMLNNCKFKKASKDIDSILPNYSEEMAIYCTCGEIVNIKSVQICTWKDEFKFYLFEGETCDCGEKIYALSLMEQDQDVPKELKEVF